MTSNVMKTQSIKPGRVSLELLSLGRSEFSSCSFDWTTAAFLLLSQYFKGLFGRRGFKNLAPFLPWSFIEASKSCLNTQILEMCQAGSVYDFWHLQISSSFLLHSACFVILSAVCYNDDANDFLGFHKLYYCKCSCVYILWRSTIPFVVWFLRHVISYIDWISTRSVFRRQWKNVYPDGNLVFKVHNTCVLMCYGIMRCL